MNTKQYILLPIKPEPPANDEPVSLLKYCIAADRFLSDLMGVLKEQFYDIGTDIKAVEERLDDGGL